jgi:hypothetical protein
MTEGSADNDGLLYTLVTSSSLSFRNFTTADWLTVKKSTWAR